MYKRYYTHTTTATIILLCGANRGGAKPFITLFLHTGYVTVVLQYWNIDRVGSYMHTHGTYFSRHTKDSKKKSRLRLHV